VNFSFFLSLATFRMRSSACDTPSRLCARCVLCRLAFPLVSALGSTLPFIIGFGSSPSRCGPPAVASGQTRDLPGSDTILARVMGSSTPAGWQYLA
jgi:hypothetical protein